MDNYLSRVLFLGACVPLVLAACNVVSSDPAEGEGGASDHGATGGMAGTAGTTAAGGAGAAATAGQAGTAGGADVATAGQNAGGASGGGTNGGGAGAAGGIGTGGVGTGGVGTGGVGTGGAGGRGGAGGAGGQVVFAPNVLTFDVEWGTETTLVDEASLALLTAADPPNGVFTFDAAGVADAGLDLAVGRLVVIHGLEVGRIVDAVEDVDALVLTTEPATLAEAIANGTLAWDYQVAFEPDVVTIVGEDPPIAGAVWPPRILAAATEPDWRTVSFTWDPFDYALKFALGRERVDLDFTITKQLVAPARAEFKVTGNVESFRSRGEVLIQDHRLREFGYGADGLRGEVVVSLGAAASGTDLSYQFKRTLLSVPILVGPIPVNVDIAGLFVVNGSVPVDGSASVSARFQYDGDTGLSYDGTTVTSDAQIGNQPPVQEGEALPSAASASQISASFGIGFPRIEVGIARSSLAGWVQSAYLVGSSFTVNNTLVPICLEANAEYIAACGYKLSVLDVVTLSEGQMNLVDEKTVLRRSGDCPE